MNLRLQRIHEPLCCLEGAQRLHPVDTGPPVEPGACLFLHGFWTGGDHNDVGVAARQDRQHGFRHHISAEVVKDDQQGTGGRGQGVDGRGQREGLL